MKTRGHPGFTLLELAVVLMIIAIITGMAVKSGIGVVAAARLSATQLKMKTINEALMQYRTAHDRLPCPGDLTLAPGSADYGLEASADASSAIAVGTGACTGTGMLPAANFTATGVTNTFQTAAEGALPAVTLGLSPDMMLDGWSNKFRYAVDISYTADAAFTNSGGAACVNGAITVNDGNGVARSSNSIYALISHGPDGHGAYSPSGAVVNAGSSSADQLTNCHCTSTGSTNTSSGVQTTSPATYVQKLPAYDASQTGNSAYYYDDLVSYRERWQMRTDWDKPSGCQYVYVADSNNNRVEEFTLSGAYAGQFGGCSSGACSSGTGNGQLNDPIGIALDKSGNIWVTDSANQRVQEFNNSGTYQFQFGYSAGYGGPFDWPFGIAFDASGNIWVVNNNPGSPPPPYAVLKFNTSGTLLSEFGSYNTGSAQLGQSSNLAIDANGNLWISEPTGPNLQEFSSSGTYLTSVGTSYPYRAQYATAFDSSGNLWTLGQPGGVNEVQEFSSSGTLLNHFGSTGSGNGQFNFTYEPDNGGIAIDPSGNLWVVDTGNNRVEEFSSSGSFIRGIGAGYNGIAGSIGSTGTGNGQFNSPQGIAISSR